MPQELAPAPASSETNQGSPPWLRMKVLVPTRRISLERLIVDTKGMSAQATGNASPLMGGAQLGVGAQY